jgi:hypothetical protein
LFEDHPAALSDWKDVNAIFWCLDFFASFLGQAKNEEPSRLEVKNKPFIVRSSIPFQM